METRWIQDFVMLADVRNFTRAAELRNVSQAALSRRIQALEQWVGAALVDRSAFPMRFTEAGERFLPSAMALLNHIDDMRTESSGAATGNVFRVALPYVLANTRVAQWWDMWRPAEESMLSIRTGNVHDAIQALQDGSVDLVIGYSHPLHPIVADADRYEKMFLGEEYVRPYCSAQAANWIAAFPGNAQVRIPFLMYPATAYFAKIVASAVEAAGAPLVGYHAAEAAMSDALAEMASQGLGVTWLPDSTMRPGRYQDLQRLGGQAWSFPVEIVAFRARPNTRKITETVWQRMQDMRYSRLQR